ncbi:hypothetical protein [Bacillus sp. B15-48]|nr:hypothetical protein [Bacillus sp. B15-48]
MVVDALIYMYFVGFGTAAGVATVVFISLQVWQRMKNKKRKGLKNGVI